MSDAILQKMESQMKSCLEALLKDFSGLRTGRATPALLEPILVDIYGGRMPLSQLGSVSAPQPRLLMVQLWDNEAVGPVQKALIQASLNPSVEGTVFKIPLPDLTQERRLELVKMAQKYTQEAHVGLRGIRRQAIEEVEKKEKLENLSEDQVHQLKKDIQKVTDSYTKKLDNAFSGQEKEILKV